MLFFFILITEKSIQIQNKKSLLSLLSLQIKASQHLISYSDSPPQFILESATGTEIEKHKKLQQQQT